jgi:small-conductance mechanosensitive channel
MSIDPKLKRYLQRLERRIEALERDNRHLKQRLDQRRKFDRITQELLPRVRPRPQAAGLAQRLDIEEPVLLKDLADQLVVEDRVLPDGPIYDVNRNGEIVQQRFLVVYPKETAK